MKCLYCGKEEAQERSTTQSFKNDSGEILVIDNVPLISCRSCGESYFTMETLSQMDTIRKNGDQEARTFSYASL
jgi:YgiT-type zinc finger domain-containing protein